MAMREGELLFASDSSFTTLPTGPYRRSTNLSHGSGVEGRPEPQLRESPVTTLTAASVTGGSYATDPYGILSSDELKRKEQLAKDKSQSPNRAILITRAPVLATRTTASPLLLLLLALACLVYPYNTCQSKYLYIDYGHNCEHSFSYRKCKQVMSISHNS